MNRDDEKLGEDLRAAASRDLPGEEFDDRVMQAIEGGGGEQVLSMEHRVSRWRGLRVAAAAVLVAVGIWAVSSGQFRREETGGGEAGTGGPADIQLPIAEQAVDWPEPIRVAITHDGKLRLDGRSVDLKGLDAALAKAVKGTHVARRGGRPSDRPAVLFGDRRARWRMVQWAMQALAGPEVRVYKISFAIAGEDGKLLVLPSFLPIGRGVSSDGETTEELIIEEEIVDESGETVRVIPIEKNPKISLQLKRDSASRTTLHRLMGKEWESRDACRKRLDRMLTADYLFDLEVDAGPDVRLEDVIYFLDAYAKNGKGGVTFVGAPPPKGR